MKETEMKMLLETMREEILDSVNESIDKRYAEFLELINGEK